MKIIVNRTFFLCAYIRVSFLMLIMLIHSLCCFGQENSESGEWLFDQPTFLSPEVSSFIRYDNMPVSLNTGRLDLNIPVIQLDDPDFDFSITLGYNSGGYKPAEPEGMVGLNWSLSFGGVITREVRGIPDNISNASRYIDDKYSFKYRGFSEVKHMNLDSNFKKQAFENPNTYLKYYKSDLGVVPFRRILDTQVEASSDMYTFNFCGYSGQFMIDFNGKAIVTNYTGRGKITVDLSGYGISDSGRTGITFVIITDDGYRYTFGGTMSAVEYTALSWFEYCSQAQTPDYTSIQAFYLTKIQAPNGRELTIGYADNVAEEYHRNPRLVIDSNPQRILKNYLLSGGAYSMYHRINGAPPSYMFSLNKIALISSVSTDREHILFFHSSPLSGAFQTIDKERTSSFGKLCGVQVDSIHRYTNSSSLKERCTFTYEFNYRRFLKKFTHSRIGTYVFAYNKMVNDTPLTVAIDHWGFWNGRYESILPVESSGYAAHLTNDRDPGEECDVALLSSVIYPTGGMACFEYEPHLIPSSMNIEKCAGGARLHSIMEYVSSNEKKPQTKRYYDYDDITTGISSGRMNAELPVYFINDYLRYSYKKDQYGNFIPDEFFPLESHYVNSNGFNLRNSYQYHLDYGTVSEYIDPVVKYPESENPLIDGAAITHLDKLGSKVLLSLVNNDSIQWTISCANSNGAQGKVLIYANLYDMIHEYVFEGNITISPYQEWGKGSYFIVLIGGDGASLTVRVTKKEVPKWKLKPIFCGKHTTTYFTFKGGVGGAYYTKFVEFLPEDQIGNAIIASPMPESDWAVKQRHHVYQHVGGKIYKKQFFGSDNQLYKEELSDYARADDSETHYALDVHTPHYELYGGRYHTWSSITQLTRFCMFRHNLVNKTVRHYTHEGKIAQEYTYQYDNEGYYLQAETRKDSLETKCTEYIYAHQMNEEPYITMKNFNILSPLVQTTTYWNGVKQSTFKQNYRILGNSTPYSRKAVVESIEESTLDNPLEKRVKNRQFDSYGNLLYQTKDEYRHIVYIWCYKGLYPIAKIENASFEQVENALGMEISSISELEVPGPITETLNILRNKLPKSLVSTYTYEPSVGMKNETDPTGLTTYYEYDIMGRLIEIYQMRNGKKEIISSYQYHIVNP